MDPNTPTPPASNEENKDDNPNPLPSPVNQEENEGDGSAKEDTTKASNDGKFPCLLHLAVFYERPFY